MKLDFGKWVTIFCLLILGIGWSLEIHIRREWERIADDAIKTGREAVSTGAYWKKSYQDLKDSPPTATCPDQDHPRAAVDYGWLRDRLRSAENPSGPERTSSST